MKIQLKINNIQFESEEEITVLEAAARLGMRIPALCYLKSLEPCTSCTVCIVKDKTDNRFFPSCATIICNGMDIDSESIEVMELRKTSLELLLSEHLGDCSGPCEASCRFDLNVPKVFDAIKNDATQTAISLLQRDLGLPFLVNSWCLATCENACRRKRVDRAVKIQKTIGEFLLNKIATSKNSEINSNIHADKKEVIRILITEPGIKSLALASFLAVNGFSVALPAFDKDRLPENGEDTLLMDIELLISSNVVFLEKLPTASEIKSDFEAVIAGREFDTMHDNLFLIKEAKQPETKKSILQGIKQAKDLCNILYKHFHNKSVYDYSDRFVSMSGYLDNGEIDLYLKTSEARNMREKSNACADAESDAISEIARCLQCNCHGFEDCRLRQYAAEYGAERSKFKKAVKQKYSIKTDSLPADISTSQVVTYEPGKCIRCGICVKITRKNSGQTGLCFINRGIQTQIDVPFGQSLSKGLGSCVHECVQGCH